jgi:hypothetical protein
MTHKWFDVNVLSKKDDGEDVQISLVKRSRLPEFGRGSHLPRLTERNIYKSVDRSPRYGSMNISQAAFIGIFKELCYE